MITDPDVSSSARDVNNLIDACQAIIRCHEYVVEHRAYNPTDAHPGDDQSFDNWSADILETALAHAPSRPRDMLIASAPGRPLAVFSSRKKAEAWCAAENAFYGLPPGHQDRATIHIRGARFEPAPLTFTALPETDTPT